MRPICLLALLGAVAFASPASAEQPEWLHAAAMPGYSGLVEMPGARVVPDGEMRIGYSHVWPFDFYNLSFGILPRVEANFSGLVAYNVPGRKFPNMSLSDKSMGLTIQLLDEQDAFSPVSAAVGVFDVSGTRQREMFYAAVGRRFGAWDAHLGYGGGRILSGPFGGVVWHPLYWLDLLAEYDASNYQANSVMHLPPARVKLPVNLGLRVQLLDNVNARITVQRGNTIGAGLSWHFNYGQPMVPLRDPPQPVPQAPRRAPLTLAEERQVEEAIREAVRKQELEQADISYDDGVLSLKFVDSRYYSQFAALQRAARAAAAALPEDAYVVDIALVQDGLGTARYHVDAQALRRAAWAQDPGALLKLLHKARKRPRLEHVRAARRFDFAYKLQLDPFLNDLAGFFKYRINTQLSASYNPWPGLRLVSRAIFPLNVNIKTAATPLPAPRTRSDIVEFLSNRSPRFEELYAEQIMPLGAADYVRLAGGLLEYEYAGLGGEWLHYFGDGHVALGGEYVYARKRRPDNSFGLQDYRVSTYFATLHGFLPPLRLHAAARAGRYLRGDVGGTLSVERTFGRGARLGFWLTRTNQRDIVGGKRYYDHGVTFFLPALVFDGRDSPRGYGFAIAPWTRDIGQALDFATLWQRTFHATPVGMNDAAKSALSR